MEESDTSTSWRINHRNRISRTTTLTEGRIMNALNRLKEMLYYNLKQKRESLDNAEYPENWPF